MYIFCAIYHSNRRKLEDTDTYMHAHKMNQYLKAGHIHILFEFSAIASMWPYCIHICTKRQLTGSLSPLVQGLGTFRSYTTHESE